MHHRLAATLLALLIFIFPDSASAAALDGAQLRWPWGLPFAGILLTIAAGPLLFAKLWHHHYGKFAFAWSVATLAPLAVAYGASASERGVAMPSFFGFIVWSVAALMPVFAVLALLSF